MTLFARLRQFAWPAPPATPFDRGLHALNRRELDEALAHFNQAYAEAEAAAGRAAAANKIGIVHVERNARDEALAAFLLAIEHDATHVPSIVNVGNLLLEDGDVEEAIVHYRAALRLDDEYSVGHLNLGVALKRLGRRGEAVREFRRATRLAGRLKPKR